MACLPVKSEPGASKHQIVYLKCRLVWNKFISPDCFIEMLKSSYCIFLDHLVEGSHGFGRFFIPATAMSSYTGHFCFIVNNAREQEGVIVAMKQMAKVLCNLEEGTYEISEQQYIEDVARCEWSTFHLAWDIQRKFNFGGDKDEHAWQYFHDHLMYLKECICKTRLL